MKKILAPLGYIIGVFLLVNLFLAFTYGPMYSLVCKTYGGIFGYFAAYSYCYYPHWWK